MKTIAFPGGATPRSPEGRSTAALASFPQGLAHLVRIVRRSTWAPILGKALLVVLALTALSALGRAAMAEERQVEAASSAPPPNLPPAPEPPSQALAQAPPVSANEPAPSEEEKPREPQAVLPDGRIVLNLAGENELVKLPGVGPKRAQAILAVRQRLGRFRRVEDLLRVKGIGRKMLDRIRPVVVLDPPREGA